LRPIALAGETNENGEDDEDEDTDDEEEARADSVDAKRD
jgi:hypothetical protein